MFPLEFSTFFVYENYQRVVRTLACPCGVKTYPGEFVLLFRSQATLAMIQDYVEVTNLRSIGTA